jgi:hypothetical protein
MLNIVRGAGTFAGVLLIIAIVAFLFILAPMLLLWSVNWMAELGGAKFYIEHSIWSYWVAFVFLLVVRGTATTSK